jgi:nicotinate-nucleotide pyrophosphorylase (carboxylating)
MRDLIAAALAEDLGPLGDITSALLPPDAAVHAVVVPRHDGVLSGRVAAHETFLQVDPSITVEWGASDGDRLQAGRAIAHVRGPLRSVLTAERTALNFLSHLSGIATLTRRYVDLAAPARIRDTRKTTPGLRALEKAAVRAGGGVNHRGNLSDGVLVKDNHLGGLSVEEAVERARRMWPGRTVQIECDTADQVKAALVAGADLVLLDNMTPDQVAACVSLVAGRCLVEVSGGVTLDTVAAYAAAGPDLIAVGAITHSAPVLDIGLDLDPDPDIAQVPPGGGNRADSSS